MQQRKRYSEEFKREAVGLTRLPGAGEAGGRIVAAGTPQQVARTPASRTAPFLAQDLGRATPDDHR